MTAEKILRDIADILQPMFGVDGVATASVVALENDNQFQSGVGTGLRDAHGKPVEDAGHDGLTEHIKWPDYDQVEADLRALAKDAGAKNVAAALAADAHGWHGAVITGKKIACERDGITIKLPAKRRPAKKDAPIPTDVAVDPDALRAALGEFATPGKAPSDADYAAAEQAMGIPVPPVLRTYLDLTAGVAGEEPADFETPEGAHPLTGWKIMTLADIVDAYTRSRDSAAEYPDRGQKLGPDDALRHSDWDAGWLPIADQEGNYLGLDLAPGPKGTAGQVIEFGTDLPGEAYRHAPSLIGFLNGFDEQRQAEDGGPTGLGSEVVFSDAGAGDYDRAKVPDDARAVRAWKGREVKVEELVGLKYLTALAIGTDKADLAGIGRLPLVSLSCASDGTDLAPLAGHPTIESLSLGGKNLRGLEAVATLPSLTSLRLDGDIAGQLDLTAMPALKTVTLSRHSPEDIAAVATLFPDLGGCVHTAAGTY